MPSPALQAQLALGPAGRIPSVLPASTPATAQPLPWHKGAVAPLPGVTLPAPGGPAIAVPRATPTPVVAPRAAIPASRIAAAPVSRVAPSVPGAAPRITQPQAALIRALPPAQGQALLAKIASAVPAKPKMMDVWDLTTESWKSISEANYRLDPTAVLTENEAASQGVGQVAKHNDPYLSTGKISVRGISDKVADLNKPVRKVRTSMAKVDAAVEQVIKTKNPQAALAAMISYQKALDDGAAFRADDRAMTMAAQSLSNRISQMLATVKYGTLTVDMMRQMQSAMRAFTNASVSQIGSDVEAWMGEADRLGYDRGSILPKGILDRLYGKIEVTDWREEAGAGAAKIVSPSPNAIIVPPPAPVR